jgi:hypothetical protein
MENNTAQSMVDTWSRSKKRKILASSLVITTLFLVVTVPLILVSTSGYTILENGVRHFQCFEFASDLRVPTFSLGCRQIDAEMSSDITKIMSRPTEKDESPQVGKFLFAQKSGDSAGRMTSLIGYCRLRKLAPFAL